MCIRTDQRSEAMGTPPRGVLMKRMVMVDAVVGSKACGVARSRAPRAR
jgi:hypothetical protein